MKRCIIVGMLCAISTGAVSAEGTMTAPMERDYQGVPYLSGGVGEAEREAIRATAEQFNLQLLFAEKSGPYLSDVAVVVSDPAGRIVLDLRSDGPLVLARLPPGDYQVSAEAKGQLQTRRTSIPADGAQSIEFYW